MSQYDPPKRPKSNRESSPLLLIVALCALVLAGASLIRQFWPVSSGDGYDPDAQQRKAIPASKPWPEEQLVVNMYKEARQSVVFITTLGIRRNVFTRSLTRVPKGTEDPRSIQVVVTLPDQTLVQAKVIGAYPEKDIAVLHLEPKDRAEKDKIAKLRPIKVGTSHDLDVGQYAFAIGNPFGLDYTLTKGIISALGREIETAKNRPPIRNVIQTDAAINPGNSGGPLLDRDGRLIGMNTAIYSPSGASAGIGFAIPVDEVNRVVTRLIRRSPIPTLGVELASEEVTRRVSPNGGRVQAVDETSPAGEKLLGVHPRRNQQGFIRYFPGDVIIRLDDVEIKSVADFYGFLEKKKVGDVVRVILIRYGEEKTIEVPLIARR